MEEKESNTMPGVLSTLLNLVPQENLRSLLVIILILVGSFSYLLARLDFSLDTYIAERQAKELAIEMQQISAIAELTITLENALEKANKNVSAAREEIETLERQNNDLRNEVFRLRTILLIVADETGVDLSKVETDLTNDINNFTGP